MSERVEAFLARVGPRLLTSEEARQLQILCITEGTGASVGWMVIKKLVQEARPPSRGYPKTSHRTGRRRDTPGSRALGGPLPPLQNHLFCLLPGLLT